MRPCLLRASKRLGITQAIAWLVIPPSYYVGNPAVTTTRHRCQGGSLSSMSQT